MTVPLGSDAMAATTTGSMNTFSIIILPMGIVFIVQSFAAQFHGQRDMLSARRYAWYGLILAAIAGVLALVGIPFLGSVLELFSYTDSVRSYMTGYLSIRMLAVFAIVSIEVLGNWYGGLGNTRLHMVAGLLAMVVNVFLNWVLIFGNLGAPALGVEGAAMASVIASWVAFFYLLCVFLRDQRGRSSRGALLLGEFGRMLRFGLPNGMNWFLEFAAFAIFINLLVADLGTTVLAAMMVVININSVSFMPAFGLSSAGAILAGQAIGERKNKQVPGVVKLTAGITATWQGCVGLVYLFAPEMLMQWFSTDEQVGPQLVDVGATMLAMSAGWQLFDAVAMTVGEALRAAGDTAWILWARLALAWLVFVPAAWLSVVVFDGGYVAAMLCLIGYMALLSGLLSWRFRSGAWMRIDLTGVAHATG